MGQPKRNRIIEEDLARIVAADLPWHDFQGKTVLVSGASGFLPAYMVETLLYLNEKAPENEIKVIGLVRNKDRALSRFASYQDRKDLQLIAQDVCEPLRLTERIDYVIHAASQASPKYYGQDPVGTLSANTLGTHNLLALGQTNSLSGFLFFSSAEVYGHISDSETRLNEDAYGYLDPTELRSCYAESKRMGETMCVAWFHQYGLPVKIIRPFHTYGPGMNLDDGRVYADFVADIVNGRDIVLKSDGKAARAFCYIADAVTGFFTVLLKGENGVAYNVGNERGETTILDLANSLVKLFPERGLKVSKQQRPERDRYLESKVSRVFPDTSKLQALGWEAETSIEEGFARTIRSFAEPPD